MKKFLKVFIIVLLVLASIVGTCYFFFRNMKEKKNTTSPLAEMLFSQDQEKFKQDFSDVSQYINSDGTDSRLDLILETEDKLDEILTVLLSYHIETNTQINNERIAKACKQYKGDKSLLQRMINEYLIKKDSIYFNRHLGANDLYEQSCNYLISYARLINYINLDLNLNKSVDLKFSMFEIYCNIITTSFNSTKETNSRIVIENSININKINSILELENSFVVTKVPLFSSEVNQFNRHYYNCNKIEFAKNLANNILNVNSNQGNSEQIATYYFKQIFGV